jgi:hypothetical protein
MGPWSSVPLRLRIAFLTLVAFAAVAGIVIALGLASLATVILTSALVAVAWVLAFDRRRPWWSTEPTVTVDPIGANAVRSILQALTIALVTAALGFARLVEI